MKNILSKLYNSAKMFDFLIAVKSRTSAVNNIRENFSKEIMKIFTIYLFIYLFVIRII